MPGPQHVPTILTLWCHQPLCLLGVRLLGDWPGSSSLNSLAADSADVNEITSPKRKGKLKHGSNTIQVKKNFMTFTLYRCFYHFLSFSLTKGCFLTLVSSLRRKNAFHVQTHTRMTEAKALDRHVHRIEVPSSELQAPNRKAAKLEVSYGRSG